VSTFGAGLGAVGCHFEVEAFEFCSGGCNEALVLNGTGWIFVFVVGRRGKIGGVRI
jgi:hypothetical protein